jgi:hypothetical protein
VRRECSFRERCGGLAAGANTGRFRRYCAAARCAVRSWSGTLVRSF